MTRKARTESHPMANAMLLGLIFTTFLKIALFVVGGGLVMLPVIEEAFVRRHRLLKHEDILDMVAITQTMPGLIAVNAALFVGHKLAGWLGAFVAVIGVILPSIVIIILIAAFLPLLDSHNLHILKAFSCVRASVTAIFLGTAWRLGKAVLKSGKDYIIVGTLIIALIWGVPPVILILSALPIGWGSVLLSAKCLEQKDQHE